MNPIFIDTLYIVALFNPRDEWHSRAVEVEPTVRGRGFVTTESVLAEVLNFFSSYGAQARRSETGLWKKLNNLLTH
jgi:predicted nucleic acid-binding protein